MDSVPIWAGSGWLDEGFGGGEDGGDVQITGAVTQRASRLKLRSTT